MIQVAGGEKSSQGSFVPWIPLQFSPEKHPRRSSGHVAEDGLLALRNAQARYHEDQHLHCWRPETTHAGGSRRGRDSILSCNGKVVMLNHTISHMIDAGSLNRFVYQHCDLCVFQSSRKFEISSSEKCDQIKPRICIGNNHTYTIASRKHGNIITF